MEKAKLRILIASDHYPPFIGGAHRQTQLLSQELHKRGHTVKVATVYQPTLPWHDNEHGVDVYRLRQLRTWRTAHSPKPGQIHQPPFPDPVSVWSLRRLIRRFKPDVIHAYGWYSYSIAAALEGFDIPLVISARDYAYGCPTRTLVYRGEELCSGPALAKCLNCASHLYGRTKGWVAVFGVYLSDELLKRKVTGIHSISTYVQHIVRRDFLNDRAEDAELPHVIIPSFRETDEDEVHSDDPDVQQYLARLPQEPFILFVGALRRVKGVEQLLAAYQHLDAPPPLVMIGTIESDTPSVFPPGVVVLEKLPHRAVMAAWERALFGVVPSLWPEPLGSVVYEGLSKGRAVIGTTPGGHTDMIVDGVTGFLVPPGDVEALTHAVQKLIDDPQLREELGRNGREHARRFTAAKSVPQFEAFYHRVIAYRRDRPALATGDEVTEAE
jgi:glycosyltransferase involved in cell wall biosynthesis